jgi:hypothetical protein
LRRFAVFAVVLPSLALATSVIERSLAERARTADRVVLAQVLDTRTVVSGTVAPRGAQGREAPRMLTVTRVVVGADYKGAGPQQLEVVQLGGRYGLWEAHVPGDATFEAGETAVLLLQCKDAKAPDRCTLVTLSEGKLKVVGDSVLVPNLSRQESTRRPLRAVIDEVRAAGKVTP